MIFPRTCSSRRAQRKVAEFYPFKTRRDFCALKREAARAVKHALRTGALKKQPCEQCRRRAEAHHEDYAKPLDVTWLCRYHHRRRDAELREMRRTAVAHIAGLPTAPIQLRSYRSRACADCTIALVRQATLEVAAAVDAEGISENLLASRMKVSRQVVNTHFAGGFRTLKVLAAYAEALGYEAVVVLRKRQAQVAS